MGKKLGTMKTTFLKQAKVKTGVAKIEVESWLNTFSDLTIEDLKGIISDELYDEIINGPTNPDEVLLWNNINNCQENTKEACQIKMTKIDEYISKFPGGKKIDDVQNLKIDLQIKIDKFVNEGKEKADWEKLNKGNYREMQTYKVKYPESVHLDELDDLMWKITLTVMGPPAIYRYLNDWPLGRHAAEANEIISGLEEWEEVKHSNDIFKVDDYKDSHPDSPFKNQINAVLSELRIKELEKMHENPSDYSKDDVMKFIDAGIFKKWELIDEGLVTEDSWEKMITDRKNYPNIQDYQIANPELEASPDCTDIYLFGTPGTGKTCLLMGLAGANGHGYSLNMRTEGGPYASALQQYVYAGITPGRTFGSFVTTIHGEVNEEGNNVRHPINLVEMSGEEFALHIADNKEVSLADMGTGATNLLQNDNRKVFFIIVDSTKEKVKFNYTEHVRDADGNIIEDRIRTRYISQLDILNKFVGLFTLPENAEIMRKVDAIHFIVTKADMLGEYSTRKAKARDLLLSKYTGPVTHLKNLCSDSRRINYNSDYSPLAFTFSLGNFYLGDVFDFEKQETLDIIQAIRDITRGRTTPTWWDRFCNLLGGTD